MRLYQLGYFVTFLGILAICSSAPDRVKRQSVQDQCRLIFNVSCDGLPNTAVTAPTLNTMVDPVVDTSDSECVIYYQCKSDGTPNDDGSKLIDRRILPCPGALEVSCKKANVDKTITNTGDTGSTGETGVTQKPPVPIPTIPVRPGCGWRNPTGVSVRITGAEDNQAQFAEFPWMVAVSERPVPPSLVHKYAGGGSLIHPRVVLTAAHAIEGKPASTLVVRVGEWDTKTAFEPYPHKDHDVQDIITHELYNTNNLHNDFALLILKDPVQTAPNVNFLCLPQETDVFDRTLCVATGWGKDNFEPVGKYQAVLKKVELPVVPPAQCQSSLRLTRLGKNFILDRSFMCAGGEQGVDTCTGDGGSPLACPLVNQPNRYVQAGIVAWGIGCGADRTPGVYANVAKARRWIDSKFAQYNFETSTYVP